MALDKYIAITHPLRYHVIMTQKATVGCIVGCWTFGVLIWITHYFWLDVLNNACMTLQVVPVVYTRVLLFTLYVTIGALLVLFHIQIATIAREHANRIATEVTCNTQHGHKKVMKNKKGMRTVSAILAAYVLAWFLYFLIDFLYLIDVYLNPLVNNVMLSIAVTLGLANSSVNFLVYAATSRDFREAYHSFMCVCHCTRPHWGSAQVFSLSDDL